MESPTHKTIETFDSYGLFSLKTTVDTRGTLCVADPSDSGFPFEVKRAFWIYGVPEGAVRGQHAHHTCAEVLVPVCGSFRAHVDDGHHTMTFDMARRDMGLFIPPMVWCSFSHFSPDCVCLCLTPEAYDREGYINSIDDFHKALQL